MPETLLPNSRNDITHNVINNNIKLIRSPGATMAKADNLGEFEHLTLLAVVRLGEEAYGASIQRELEEQAVRQASVSAVYITLTRLEGKRLVESWKGEPTESRGGKSKRHFKATAAGMRALNESKEKLMRMWDGIEEAMSAAGAAGDAE